jgi:hypothetical protein
VKVRQTIWNASISRWPNRYIKAEAALKVVCWLQMEREAVEAPGVPLLYRRNGTPPRASTLLAQKLLVGVATPRPPFPHCHP